MRYVGNTAYLIFIFTFPILSASILTQVFHGALLALCGVFAEFL